jgi:glutathione S-transferase
MSSPKLIVHHLQVGQGERIPWLLEELNIPYELKLYKRSPLTSPPELQAVHPMGASPVLEDVTDPSNPIKIAESGAICDYIIHKYANGRLALEPQHKNYAEYIYWLHFSNGTLQPALLRRTMTRGMVGEQDPRYKDMDARVHKAVDHINNRLQNNKWLAGEEFTAADVMTGWCFTTMRTFEPNDLSDYQGILGWLGRVGEREAYTRAMGKSDPDINLEQSLSAKGLPISDAFVKLLAPES